MNCKIIILILTTLVSSQLLAASIEKAELLIENALYIEAKEELIDLITSDSIRDETKAKAYYLLGKLNLDLGNENIGLDTWLKLLDTYPDSDYAKSAQRFVDELESKQDKEGRYVILKPAFTVSIEKEGATKFVQASFGISPKTNVVKTFTQENSQEIRNKIILLLSSFDLTSFTTKNGNKEIEKQVLEIIRSIKVEQQPSFIESVTILKIVVL